MISELIHLVGKVIWNAVIVLVCASLVFIAYKANQPMAVAGAPEGMTYAEFMLDRLDAAKTVKPSQCGWGMMLSLAAIGPIYSVLYTSVGINPNGFLAKVTAPDSDIPKDVAEAKWYEVPGIWWNVVERISWTMLGKQRQLGCKFRSVIHQ